MAGSVAGSSSWYRRSVWQVKGNREFSRSGYEAAASKFSPDDLDVDCTGRHYLITGANTGIGYSTAFEVARRGGVIHMVCRNLASAKQARATIVSETGNDKLYLHTLDLSRPREVFQFCDTFLRCHDRLHVLVNTAASMVSDKTMDEDNIEYNFAVNILSPHIIVTSLAPLLQSCEDSRVVTVSGAGMLLVKLDPQDIMNINTEPYCARTAHAHQKRQQVVLTLCYAQIYDLIHFSSMHPGWADTRGFKECTPDLWEALKDRLRSPSQGADTAVWLAVSNKTKAYSSGLFYQDRESVSTHLPLAWTRSSAADEKTYFDRLQEITNTVRGSTPTLGPTLTEGAHFENGKTISGGESEVEVNDDAGRGRAEVEVNDDAGRAEVEVNGDAGRGRGEVEVNGDAERGRGEVEVNGDAGGGRGGGEDSPDVEEQEKRTPSVDGHEVEGLKRNVSSGPDATVEESNASVEETNDDNHVGTDNGASIGGDEGSKGGPLRKTDAVTAITDTVESQASVNSKENSVS